MKKIERDSCEEEIRDANTCMALGVGVGALGAGAAVLASAACPLCVVIAPALVGTGALKRVLIAKSNKQAESKSSEGKDALKEDD